MQDSAINLYKDPFVQKRFVLSKDTVLVAFRLINDLEQDTILYFYENRCNWIHIISTDILTKEVYETVSGRDYYTKVEYDYLYFPARPIRFKSGHLHKNT